MMAGRRSGLTYVALASSCLLAATILFPVIIIASKALSLYKPSCEYGCHHLSISDGLHLWFTGQGLFNPGIVIFNDGDWGPIQSTMFWIGEGPSPHKPQESYITETGVYFRHVRSLHYALVWTLIISLWYPFVLFAIAPALWLRRRLRHKRSLIRALVRQ